MSDNLEHLSQSLDLTKKLQSHYDYLIRIIDDPFPKLDELADQIQHQANEEKISTINIVIRAMQNADKDGEGDYITFFAAAFVHLHKRENQQTKLQNETGSNI